MEFTSLPFLVLVTITFFLYYIVEARYRKAVLLLGSCVFIGYYNIWFLVIAAAIASATFLLGRYVYASRDKKALPIIFTAAIVLLVGVWTFFRHNSIIIPLGISFYSFQALSYITDIYWEEEKPAHSYWDFMLYMMLFMKFLSGPIERSKDLMPQFRQPKIFDYEAVTFGMKLMLIGLIKKLVLADNLAPYLDTIFSNPTAATGLQLTVASLLYPIQLYADFSGYTDMAIGAASLFGYKLSPNFNRPFISQTTSDLWRRWHMTLSFWVRDYIFVPLTSVFRSWGRTGILLALLITFSALGVWHGVGLNYVIYGLIQGLIICYEMNVKAPREFIVKVAGERVGGFLLMIRTYLLFAFSLIFFRAGTLSNSLYIVGHLSLKAAKAWTEIRIGIPDRLFLVTGLTFLALLIYEHFDEEYDLLHNTKKIKPVFRWCIYYALIFALLTLGQFDCSDFIYLQF